MEPLRDAPQTWPVHEVEHIWKGEAPFSVRRDLVSAPGRPDDRFGRLVLDHPGAVVILAVDELQRVLVVQQYRHPVGQRLVELPAGQLAEPGEDPGDAAARELREEGLVLAERWTELMTTYASPGLSSERITYFLAEGLSQAPDRGGFEPVHEEAEMTTRWVPLDELLEGVLAGRRADAPLVQAVMAYTLRQR
jgi:ADP-ribose pyrophosphatase